MFWLWHFARIFLLLFPLGLFANPQGGVVTSGGIQFSQPNGSTLQINQSTNKAIINWQTFNIGAGETTQFVQPSSSSITLNRVNGLNGSSAIFGNLLANGQVWIINPAGIVFGKGAQVNVGGLLATTSNITDEDFLSGNYKFSSDSEYPNAAIINHGTIQVQPGGLVALIGNTVENKGTIHAKMGTVILGGAQAYTLDFDGDQLINFVVAKGSSKKGGVYNSGVIDVGAGAVMTPRNAKTLVQNTINMSGDMEATQVSSSGGVIILDAGGGKVKVSGKMIAKGGNVIIKGRKIKASNASIDTSGEGSGGNIYFLSSNKLVLKNTQLSANSLTSGGTITLLGKNIALNTTQLQANGNISGGTVLIGGNAYGAGPQMNAINTSVSRDSSISADALVNGKAGKIVVWSDDVTKVYGSLTAKGGLLGGDGGFIETSGKHYLDVAGISINLTAANGKTGLWLLDPSDITISNGATTNMDLAADVYSPSPSANTSILNVTDLVTQLGFANIQVVTTNTPAGAGAGNITVATPIVWNTPNTLTLTADPLTGQVNVNSAITASGLGAGLNLLGNTISIAAPITTNNGNVSFTGATTIIVANAVTTGTGSQTYNSSVTLAPAGLSTTLTGGAINMTTVNIPGSTNLDVRNSGTSAITGQISGAGNLIKSGGGILTLSGNNTNTGITTINLGTLALGSVNSIAPQNSVILANAAGVIFDLQNFNITIASLSGGGITGGNVNLGSGTLTIGGTNASMNYAGIISGSGGLIKEGTGTFTLTSGSSYTGATLINGGIFSVSSPNAFGSAPNQTSSITIASGATLRLVFSGTLANTTAPIIMSGTGSGGIGALTTGVNTSTLANPITLASNTMINVPFNTLTLSGAISDSGMNYRLTKIGAGTLALSNSNSYGGGTTFDGPLRVTNANALGTTGTIIANGSLSLTLGGITLANSSLITFTTGSLNIFGFGTQTDTLINPIVLNNTISVSNQSPLATLQLLGNISGTGGITLPSQMILLLGGTNTYTGATTVNAATLRVTNPSALGNAGGGPISFGAGSTTLSLELGGASLDNLSDITAGGTNFTLINTAPTATTTLMTNNLTLNSGALFIDSVNSGANLVLSGAITNNTGSVNITGSGNTNITGVIGNGSGNLIKSGTGTLTLSNANTYTGTTNIISGTVIATNPDALGPALGTNTITVNGTLDLNFNGTLTNTSPIQISSILGTLRASNASGTTLTLANPVSFTSSGTINALNSNATLALNGNITNGTFVITLGGAGNIDVNGSIGSSTGGLTKSGSGTLTLNNINTYSGLTTINAGILRLGISNAINSGSSLSLANVAGALFDLANFSNTIGSLSGGGNLGGNVTLGSGSLTAGNNGSSTYSGVISGSGGLTKIGTGSLTLSRVNTYTGATIINGGTLRLGIANAINSGSAVSLANVAGATFDLANFSNTIGSLAGGGNLGGNVTLGLGTLTTGGDNRSTNYSGVISGIGALTKIGSGIMSLSGVNTYTGATTVNNGTLRLGIANAISSSSSVSLANVAGVTFDLANFSTTIGSLAGGGNLGGNVTLGSGTLTTGGNNSSTIYSGIISGSGGLTKTGATGTMTLSGVNTYTGATTINAGTLRLGIANAIDAGSAVTLANFSATVFNLANFNSTIGSLAGGGNLGGNVTLGSGTLTTGGDNTSTTYSGVISGTGGLTKTGSGIMTLSGVNTYTGATTINNGTLRLGIVNALNSGAAVTLTNVAGAVFDLANFSPTIGSLAGGGSTGGNVTLGSGTLTTGGNNTTTTYSGVMSGTGGLTKAGTGSMTLGGVNTYTGATNINAGTLAIGVNDAISASSDVSLANVAGAIFNLQGFNDTIGSLAGGGNLGGNVILGAGTLSTGANNNSTIYSGNISGSGNFIKLGTGTMGLASANTYTGSTAVNAGTLNATHTNALGSSSGGTISVANDATLGFNLNGGTLANNKTITLTGTARLSNFTASGTTDTLDNPIVLTAGGTPTIASLNSGASLILSLASNITNNTANLTFNAVGDIDVLGVIGSGSGAITKTGAGTLTLQNVNTYTGLTSINAGTLALGLANAILPTNGVALANVAGAVWDLRNFNVAMNTLSGGGPLGGDVNLGLGTLTIGGDNGTSSYSGSLFGTGGLTKVGNGTFTIGGNNAYSGSTLVNNGILELASINALGSGVTQSDEISILPGATLAIGFPVGTLTNNTPIELSGIGEGGIGALIGTTSTGTLSNALIMRGNTTFGGTGNLILSGIVSQDNILNDYTVTKVGTNSITFSNANTFTGDTIIQSGDLNITNVYALGTESSIYINGGTLSMNFGGAVLQNMQPMYFNGGGITDNTAPGTLDMILNPIVLSTSSIFTPTFANATLAVFGPVNNMSLIVKGGDGILLFPGPPPPPPTPPTPVVPTDPGSNPMDLGGGRFAVLINGELPYPFDDDNYYEYLLEEQKKIRAKWGDVNVVVKRSKITNRIVVDGKVIYITTPLRAKLNYSNEIYSDSLFNYNQFNIDESVQLLSGAVSKKIALSPKISKEM